MDGEYLLSTSHFLANITRYASCFVGGMLLADLHLLQSHHELPNFISRMAPYRMTISYTGLIIGLYLGGAPAFGNKIDNYRDAPGWHYLSYLRPSAAFNPKAFYLFWAALFTVAAIPNIHWLKSFFELQPIQYLGKVSYAFYLVHGPILWTLGDRVYAAIGFARRNHAEGIASWVDLLRLPAWGPVGLEFNFLCAHIVLLPFTLWIAGVVTRVVDEPVLRGLGQGYRNLLREETEKETVELLEA